MKTGMVMLSVAAAVGAFVLLKNVGRAQATPMPAATAPGFQLPQWPNSYPMYEIPQTSMPKQTGVNVGLSTSGVSYQDDKLGVTLGLDFLKNIPVLGDIFGSRDVQKEGVAKVAP